jgi:CheY-like chemotaxis protein
MRNGKLNILLIDDDAISTTLLKEFFKITLKKEPKTQVCHDIKSCKEFLERAHGINTFPDIILLDINLPDGKGYDLLDVYEKDFYHLYPETAVFLVSGSTDPKDFAKGATYQCLKKYIVKDSADKIVKQVLEFTTISVE